VCGAPARTRRMAKGVEGVLVVGAGCSGQLAAAAAREALPAGGRVACIDRDASHAALLEDRGVVDDHRVLDATDAVAVRDAASEMFAQPPELVVDTCNVAGTETGAILACRQRGAVCFFNMATSFSTAALAAEGAGADIELTIGNGYVEGHAEYALDLVRRHPFLRERFGEE
ncbi:MAG: L-erythro-3,5-diaminohexanoate dehydrogenase, partial [Bradymonadaceae bacterium]